MMCCLEKSQIRMQFRKLSFEKLFLCSILFCLTANETTCEEPQYSFGSTESQFNDSTQLKDVKITRLTAVGATTCKLPSDKEFMIVKNAITGEEIAFGAEVRKDTPLIFTCASGYSLKGLNNTICGAAGRWVKELPICISFCSDHHPRSGFSTRAYFEINGIDVSYNQRFEVNTVAKINCADSFNKPSNFENTLVCTDDGWRDTKIPCEMECGQPAAPITQFSRGGSFTNITQVPWHVGIYQEVDGAYENICSGVLISPRIVISAAHCFFHTDNIQPITNLAKFTVVAGKYYRDYNSNKELNKSPIQIRSIFDIWVPNDYAGKKKYFLGDLAILKLTQFVTFSEAVRPVCLFASNEIKDTEFKDFTGKVSTWSQKTFKEPLSTLKTLIMSTVPFEKCNETLSEDLVYKLPADKFCLAPFDTESGACKGDSGSGFVVKKQNTNEFVLLGIVSFSPVATVECSRHNLLIMTNVSYYQEVLEKFKSEDLENDVEYENRKKTCKVPDNSLFMTITNFLTDVIVNQGYNAPVYTAYKISCDSEHVLKGSKIAICRPNGRWLENFPKCVANITNVEKEEQILDSSDEQVEDEPCHIWYKNLYIKAENALTGEIIPVGNYVPVNTIVIFSCDPGYLLDGDNYLVCERFDTWYNPFCVPYCTDRHPRSGFSTMATFKYVGDVSQESRFLSRTVAKITCAPYYEQPTSFRETLNCTPSGWFESKVACNMKCGHSMAPLKSIFPGQNVFDPNAPWNVGIYMRSDYRYEIICGGTLISPRIVVSAAFCFFKEQRTKFTRIDLTMFKVVGGKSYRKYYREEDDSVVERNNIMEIWTPQGFNGAENDFYRDIAIVKLDHFMTFSDTIRPACLHFDKSVIPTRLPMICSCTSKQDTVTLKGDKFCVGPKNGSEEIRGSGIVHEMPDGSFALRGVISFSLSNFSCNSGHFYAATDALFYISYLKDAKDRDLANDIDVESLISFN